MASALYSVGWLILGKPNQFIENNQTLMDYYNQERIKNVIKAPKRQRQLYSIIRKHKNLKPILDVYQSVEILIVGMGEGMAFLAKDVRAEFESRKIAVEVMDTGATARTYNVLLQEGRKVTAALIAI